VQHRALLRRWWSGYWMAPMGTIAGLVLLTALDVTTRSRPFTVADAYEVMETAYVGVLVSYIVGLGLLPAFVAFEKSGWTDWTAYVPAGAITGMLTGMVITYPAPVNATLHGFSTLLGIFCSLIFSVRVGIDRLPLTHASGYPPAGMVSTPEGNSVSKDGLETAALLESVSSPVGFTAPR
jgi:hypothetical protein